MSGAVLLVLCMASTIFAIIRKITIFAFEAKETSTGDVIGASTWWLYGGVDVRVDVT